jgi:hypothetical protein
MNIKAYCGLARGQSPSLVESDFNAAIGKDAAVNELV